MKTFEKKFRFDEDVSFNHIPSHRSFRRLIPSILNKYGGPDTAIIDIGAGNGDFSNYLFELGRKVEIVEPSESGREIIEAKYPQLQIIHDEAYSRFGHKKNESNHVYTALEVIEHCFDPVEFLTCIYDSMDSGEYFLLTTPYHGYLKNLAICLLDRWDDHHNVFWPNGHIKFFSKKTLSRMLELVGFKIVENTVYGRIPCLARGMIFLVQK